MHKLKYMIINRILHKNGFSLIELMVVIMILSIMATFAMQYYTQTIKRAQITKAQQDMQDIKNAIKMYTVQTGGQYPPGIDALIGKYLSTAPVDPWGTPYKLDTNKLEVYCIIKKTGVRLIQKF